MEALHSHSGGRTEDIGAHASHLGHHHCILSCLIMHRLPCLLNKGMVLDTTIGSFTIPPTSLATFDMISVIIWVPIYDRILRPIARRFTGKERGFSEIQRIGIGLFISISATTIAAPLEMKRLDIVKAEHLEHPKVAVPLSILC